LHDEDEFSDQDMDDEERRARTAAQKRLKIGAEPEFLEVGSTSWSMLMALYFLMLHDDSKDASINFDSIHEMIEVLKNEFGDMVPLVNEYEKLIGDAPYDLKKFKEHNFIELVDNTVKDHFQWKMIMTPKGIKRAKGLCKSVGLVVNLEVDLNDK